MHIGLFFGSFNPIHHGHLIIAETAQTLTDLDRVWLVVSPQNPFKQKKNLLSEYHRLRMVELGIGDSYTLQASNVEFHLPQPSYTVDTLLHLREKYPGYTFSLVMGADNLLHLSKWKNHEAILEHYRLFVYPRNGKRPSSQFDEHEHVTFFEAPLLDISATYIRESLKKDHSIRYLVPDPVKEYLEEIRAYR
ncbi:MAG: nicotinate (nicotinamide) nucleotide adenylyltransferase [Bacteroidota bacterium]